MATAGRFGYGQKEKQPRWLGNAGMVLVGLLWVPYRPGPTFNPRYHDELIPYPMTRTTIEDDDIMPYNYHDLQLDRWAFSGKTTKLEGGGTNFKANSIEKEEILKGTEENTHSSS